MNLIAALEPSSGESGSTALWRVRRSSAAVQFLAAAVGAKGEPREGRSSRLVAARRISSGDMPRCFRKTEVKWL
jgi:hypothetical protein